MNFINTMAESELYYNFNNDKRGIALLINNEIFEKKCNEDPRNENPGYKDRIGDTKDRERMNEMFGILGFEVHSYRNLDSDQILEKAQKVARLADVHKKSDCFVCVIATHGEEMLLERPEGQDNYKVKEHVIIGSDNKPVKTSEIVQMFDNDHCDELKDKPKIFFIQACRTIKGTTIEEGMDEGFTVTSNSNTEIQKEIPSANKSDGLDSKASGDKEFRPKNDLDSKQLTEKKCVPQVAYVDCPEDTLLIFASLEGNFAVRNRDTGGWLLSSLYNQVKQNLKSGKLWTTDFIHILNGTLNEMANKQYKNEKDWVFSPGCLTHALTKDVLFTKKT